MHVCVHLFVETGFSFRPLVSGKSSFSDTTSKGCLRFTICLRVPRFRFGVRVRDLAVMIVVSASCQ